MAFERKMALLLEQYNLSMDEIEFEEHRVEEPIKEEEFEWGDHGMDAKLRRDSHAERLMEVLYRKYGAHPLVQSGSNRIWIVGREAAR